MKVGSNAMPLEATPNSNVFSVLFDVAVNC